MVTQVTYLVALTMKTLGYYALRIMILTSSCNIYFE